MRKKGNTLLELIVSVGIISFLISAEVTIYLINYAKYTKSIKFNKNFFYAEEAIAFLEYETKNSTLYITTDSKKLSIYKTDGTVDVITLDTAENSLNISYEKNGVSVANNKITSNIKCFEVKQIGAIIFLKLITMDGETYQRCLAIKIQM